MNIVLSVNWHFELKNGLSGSKEMMASISVLAYTVQQVKKVKCQKNMLNFFKDNLQYP